MKVWIAETDRVSNESGSTITSKRTPRTKIVFSASIVFQNIEIYILRCTPVRHTLFLKDSKVNFIASHSFEKCKITHFQFKVEVYLTSALSKYMIFVSQNDLIFWYVS